MIKILGSDGSVIAKVEHGLPFFAEILELFTRHGCRKWEHDERQVRWYEPCKCCEEWGCQEGCECFKHM